MKDALNAFYAKLIAFFLLYLTSYLKRYSLSKVDNANIKKLLKKNNFSSSSKIP